MSKSNLQEREFILASGLLWLMVHDGKEGVATGEESRRLRYPVCSHKQETERTN